MRKTRNVNALLKDVVISFAETVIELCKDNRYKKELVAVEKDFSVYRKLFNETVDYTFYKDSSKFTFDDKILTVLSSKMKKAINRHYDKYVVECTADKMADMLKVIIDAYLKKVEERYVEQTQGVNK